MRAGIVLGGLWLALGCASPSPLPAPPPEQPEAPQPQAPAPPDAGQGPQDAGLPPSEPLPCPFQPCAERPIVFIHGIVGSCHDFQALVDGLIRDDGRFDDYVWSGNEDHRDFRERSIGRRSWLFVFDYYNRRKEDARGAYTSGPGRIGSDRAFACEQPAGPGNLVATHPDYDEGVAHEYSADLAAFVESVRRATGAEEVDLVAHSMGGVISRSYLAYHGGNGRVRNLVLLASPVHGVPLVGLLNYVGLGFPAWMGSHEAAELDGAKALRKVSFRRCGLTEEPTAFGTALLRDEEALPPLTRRFVVSGTDDLLIGYDVAHHPLALSHDVAQGADHAGVLRHELTLRKVQALAGGRYEPR